MSYFHCFNQSMVIQTRQQQVIKCIETIINGFIYQVHGTPQDVRDVVCKLISFIIGRKLRVTIQVGACLGGIAKLFYVEGWTKINGRLACTQVKCSWLLPSFADHVDYARARDINFTSTKKIRADLDSKISKFHSGVLNLDPPQADFTIHASTVKEIPAPTEAVMNNFCEELSKCRDSKLIVLSLIPQFAESYVLLTINDLFDKKYLDLTYPRLLKVCNELQVDLSKEQIKAVKRDTISQTKGNNF